MLELLLSFIVNVFVIFIVNEKLWMNICDQYEKYNNNCKNSNDSNNDKCKKYLNV